MASSRNRRNLLIALVVATLLFVWGGFSVYRYCTNVSANDLSLRRQLVGTWVNKKNGDIIHFRSDGTARWRSGDGTSGIQYAEWTTSKKKLSLFLGIPERRYKILLQRYIFRAGFHNEIVEASDDRILVLDDALGELITLVRTSDVKLENNH